MRTMRLLLLFLIWLSGFLAHARQGEYAVVQKTVLSGTAEAVTVQMPANAGARSASFTGASIYCSVECEFTVERDGTAATTTAITVQKLNSTAATATATAYSSSNVGTSTVIGRQVTPAGATVALDLGMKGLVAGDNLTIRTAAITGTVIINIDWVEY